MLNSAPFRWVGLLSYSIYVWQQPFLDPEGTAIYNRFPLNLFLAAAFSVASYYQPPLHAAEKVPGDES